MNKSLLVAALVSLAQNAIKKEEPEMTTLSKEDIDLAAEKFDYSDFSGEFRTSADGLHTFADHIATLARADLVAENERLKGMVSIANKGKKENLTECLQLTEQLTATRTELRANEALAQPRDNSALREMIAGVYEECAKTCDDLHDQWRWGIDDPVSGPSECRDAIRALAEKARHSN